MPKWRAIVETAGFDLDHQPIVQRSAVLAPDQVR
jgi:hypothetical protein